MNKKSTEANAHTRSPGFWLIVGGSVLYLLLVYNRWIVTDLGLASFGRVWHLFVSYWDFGFLRRSLAGTLLDTLNLRAAFSNDYHYAYAVYSIQLVFLYILVLRIFAKLPTEYRTLLAAVVFLSPAFIIQAGYLSGSQDVTVLILVILAIFYTSRFPAVLALCATGLLVHELFFFCIPTILFLHAMRALKEEGGNPSVGRLRKTIALKSIVATGLTFAILFLVVSVGRLAMDQGTFEAIMAAKMPDAAHVHPLWSGYFEVSSSTAENATANLARKVSANMAYLALPLIYCLVLACLAARPFWQLDRRAGVASLLCTLFPLAIVVLASDVYRWFGMSANLSLLSLLFAFRLGQPVLTRSLLVLLPFSLLAPLGSFPWDRPFPLHQFVLEKLI